MNTPPRSILIVDADESFRKSLAEFFEDRGWRVVQAVGSVPAIDEIRRSHIDAVIVDPRLKDGNIEE